jgi:hypothetical protein
MALRRVAVQDMAVLGCGRCPAWRVYVHIPYTLKQHQQLQLCGVPWCLRYTSITAAARAEIGR